MDVRIRCMLGCLRGEGYHAIPPLNVCEAQLEGCSVLGVQLPSQVHGLLGIRLEESLSNLRPCEEEQEGSGMLRLAPKSMASIAWRVSCELAESSVCSGILIHNHQCRASICADKMHTMRFEGSSCNVGLHGPGTGNIVGQAANVGRPKASILTPSLHGQK